MLIAGGVVLLLFLAWLSCFLASFAQIVAEALTVRRALDDENGVRLVWRARPHLWFKMGSPRRGRVALEAAGFTAVGARDEHAGIIRIPEMVFVSADQQIVATIWVWRWLSVGQLRGHLSLWSRAGETLVGTTEVGPNPGKAVLNQVLDTPLEDRLAAHRALLASQEGEPARFATQEDCDGLALEIHRRGVAHRRLPPPAPPGMIDGREVARQYLDPFAS
jgi:hypothetical protein